MKLCLKQGILDYMPCLLSSRNPNFGDKEGNDRTKSVWVKYTIPIQTFKELEPGLPDIRAYRSAYCAFWNQIIPDLIYYKGRPILLNLFLIRQDFLLESAA